MYQNPSADFQLLKIMESKFFNYLSDEIEKNKNNKPLQNAYKKSQSKFNFVKKIIKIAKERNISYHKALLIDHKKRKNNRHKDINLHRSLFYQYLAELKIILNTISNKYNWNPTATTFKNIINESTIPKKPHSKFNKHFAKNVADMYYEPKDFQINRLNVYKEINKHNEIISYKTVCRLIYNDPRNLKLKQINSKVDHPLRKWTIDVGKIQMDVKVLGPNETKFKKYIYILDAKDEQSKLYWSKLLIDQSKEEILVGLIECINFYKEHGIDIKRIRTDNAMIFKKTNVVNTGAFNKICSNFGIEHEFIPKRQPECNGVIERQHRILDMEFKKCIDSCNSIQDVALKLSMWTENFNTNRYHTYTDLRYQKKQYLYRPIEWIKKFCLKNKNSKQFPKNIC